MQMQSKAKQNLGIFGFCSGSLVYHKARRKKAALARRQEAVNVVFAFQNNENAGNGANEENHDHAPLARCLLPLLFLPVLMRLDKKLSVCLTGRMRFSPSPDGWFYVAAIENTNPR